MHAEANAYTGTPDEGGKTKAETRPLKGPQIVDIQGAEKRFNNIYAVRNVSVAIGAGEMLSIIGPVGSGKSTLLRIAFGLLKPDEGKVTLYGSTDLLEGRSRAGYLPERPQFHENFTGEEYLLFHARLSGLSGAAARAAAARAIEITGLGEGAKRRIGMYAPEMVQRLGLGVALVSVDGRPNGLLVLDELSSGLGRGSQAAAREVLAEFRRKGGAVLLASNRITEVERACTHVAIMREGSIVMQREVDNAPRIIMLARPPQPLSAATPAATLRQAMRALHPGAIVTGPDGENRPLVTSLPALPDPIAQMQLKAAALRTVLDARWDVTYVSVENRELESVYMEAMAPREVRPLPSRPRAVAVSSDTGKLPSLSASLVPDTGKLATLPVSRVSETDKLRDLPATPAPTPEPPTRNGQHAEPLPVLAEESAVEPTAEAALDSAVGAETEHAPLLSAEEPYAPPGPAPAPPWLARDEQAAPESANRGWWE